jgi:5-methylcytosine-specific restriction endonuclease McrA
MQKKKNPRRQNGARRNALRHRVAASGAPCAICGGAIDYDLPPGHPFSFELDEIIPVSKGGDPFDPENVQPAHRRCNRLKSNKILDLPKNCSKLPWSRHW